MALQARHRYIVQRLNEAFEFNDEEAVEELMRRDSFLARINAFFGSRGPDRIFIFHERGSYDRPGSEPEPNKNMVYSSRIALYYSDGTDLDTLPQTALQNIACYFMKRGTGKGDRGITLDPLKGRDGSMVFGTVRDPMRSLEAMMRSLYQPMLRTSSKVVWGAASEQHKTEFTVSVDAFSKNLSGSLQALGGGLELRQPSGAVYDLHDPVDQASSPKVAQAHLELLEEWCTSIEGYLSDTDRLGESQDSGPDSELEYWRRRMQRLTSITDQLKTKRCKQVVVLLTAVTKQPEDEAAAPRNRVLSLMRRWRQVDVCITKAANEAKDNSKFLSTLERFLEPLRSGTPHQIIDGIPALMNALKMVHTISRFFNTSERMTKLFMKITNSMVKSCRLAINGTDTSAKMWERSPGPLLEILETCLRMNEFYQEQYKLTKDKLSGMPTGRQFDFAEAQLFGKFDLFCRRLIKLIDVFSTIQQFKALVEHKLEGMEPLLLVFDQIIDQFREKKHDLLDYNTNKFDRDYVEFNVRVGELETSLQHFINRSFESISSIEQSLQLLKKYQDILHRETLRADLDNKFMIIFHNYGLELASVQETYEKHKHAPPSARNLPPVAGNITWARHLLRRIEEPMKRFQSNKAVLGSSREAKRIVKAYNKVARTLVAFEFLWYEAWCKSIEAAKAGLRATLVIRHPSQGTLHVNFDAQVLQLIREAKCLQRISIEIPEGARTVQSQELRFKGYYDELRQCLADLDRITGTISPTTLAALKPHVATVEAALRPGMVALTWTSMNLGTYAAKVRTSLNQLEHLVGTINDLVENRIEKNLKVMARILLVDLPTDRSVTLDEFVSMQEMKVRTESEILVAKNLEVETAVEDLVEELTKFPLDPSSPSIDVEAVNALRVHYNKMLYTALLNCVKNSLNKMKARVCARGGGTGFLFVSRPFFVVDVQLSVPSVRLAPSLDDVQRSINRSAVAVLGCAKRVFNWGQLGLRDERKTAFFDRLGRDTEIVKIALLLTGALFATKNQVTECLNAYKQYDWLWKDDRDKHYAKFLERSPTLGNFEDQLQKFMDIESAITKITPMTNIGALTLNTANYKLQLRNESRQWKQIYSTKIHHMARDALRGLLDYIRTTSTKLHTEVTDLDSLRYVMLVLKDVRERESSIEMEIAPVFDMYAMLDHYLPGGLVDKDEMDQKSVLRPSWHKLADLAEDVADELGKIQGHYKKKLVLDVREFKKDCAEFRSDFEVNGPGAAGCTPEEAVERLKKYKNSLTIMERKMEMYIGGEELFALRTSKFPEMQRTRKEVGLLDQLYGLYIDVLQSVEKNQSTLWIDVPARLQEMTDETNGFDLRCKKMPKRLREWKAYESLRQKVTDFQDLLPLISELAKPSIKPRHWRDMFEQGGFTLPFDKEAFQLQDIFESPLLKFKEQVEEICEGADKQLGIETKLSESRETWTKTVFTFGRWKGRDCPVLQHFGVIIDDLEEAQMNMQTLMSMRHVGPFREPVAEQLAALSNTADTLELWIKVQLLWTALESVFMGGDIARQMPLEAKKFLKVDRDFVKLMGKAEQTQVVLNCCANELLINTLPVLYDELERCQKSLEGYLEQKRAIFPRFYFVSNAAILIILSQGSDPLQMQPYYEKVFDSVNEVEHDKNDKTKILAIKNIDGADFEAIKLKRTCLASGSIEVWLGKLVIEMQRTLKQLCETAAAQCAELSLEAFVNANCAQFALLGIQFNWTAQFQEALEKAKQNKDIVQSTNRQQLAVLQELSSWCLNDLKTKMNRRKIETLVTIHVHQRDVSEDLAKMHAKRKGGLDAGDFEWLKQARFYWRPDAKDDHGESACVVSVCDVEFTYSFEYLGCKERLVITPLTDRCYITLSQALGMHLGGAPAGPAGTGKTETVKDLGRALGVFVVVTNCTDQQRYTDMAKIFKGLCQGGLWGCFDEFNRIELPVLSVVAQQVLAITNAKRVGAKSFSFPGDPQVVGLIQNVAYFITMNPGYAGRQELPENLKVLFRSVSMMVPDREIIMKVKLCSVGYTKFVELAKKFFVLYGLCEQQLSKQKHYDFGLRNILSVLRTAGATKRKELEADESLLLMRTLRDMNLSKFVAQDVPLFLSLLSDLFPSITIPQGGGYEQVQENLTAVIQKHRLIDHASWRLKVIQLYETTLVRHGIMLVGPPGAGKSNIINVLQDVLARVMSIAHKRVRMNPKAIRAEEMFGETDRLSGEWIAGIFAAMWGKFNDRARKDNMWILCDGPVDAVWIENLNTVLDDNKILTLANGDRIPMTDNVKLMFEVEDLRNASPATVSRAGIIFVSESDLDWEPVLESWLRKCDEKHHPQMLREHFENYLGHCASMRDCGVAFEWLRDNCNVPISVSRVGCVEKTLTLLDALLAVSEISESIDDAHHELERLVLFSLTWGVAGLLESEDRLKWDAWLRSMDSEPTNMPLNVADGESIFEYGVNSETMEWERYVLPSYKPPRGDVEDWSGVLVPTLETTRCGALLAHLRSRETPVLLLGGSGTAKTSTAYMFFDSLDGDKNIIKKMNFSFATTPGSFQGSIEAELDKQGGKSYGPPTGKRMTIFLDDLSMPEVNTWGDQPTLELARQLVETGGVCFLDKDKRGDVKEVRGVDYVAAMDLPGGGKNDIPNRLKRHFFMLTVVTPSPSSVAAIYGILLSSRFDGRDFKYLGSEFPGFVQRMPGTTMALFKWLREKMLPSPTKFHYTYTLKDLSRLFQGILRTPKSTYTQDSVLVQLWRHECERVFSDKLVNLQDKEKFRKELDSVSRQLTGKSLTKKTPPDSATKKKDKAKKPVDGVLDVHGRCTAPALFVDFLRDDEYDEDGILLAEAPKIYEVGGDLESLRDRSKHFLGLYNEEHPARQMHLVIFDDALLHLVRISRVLGMPRGNLMLVGVGGSGKQSLTHLASYMAASVPFQIVLTKQYNLSSFLEDLRLMYKTAGQQRKKATFIFTDSQIKDENFLELLNSLLMTGEIPGLFPKDELQIMAGDIQQYAPKGTPVDTPESLTKFFFDTVRRNLHVVLCFSPVNAKFADRARKFPGLITGCAIDWFLGWPKEALRAVSEGFVGDMAIQCTPQVKVNLIEHMAFVHNCVVECCEEYFQKMRRHVYQTPTSYLAFIQFYKRVYGQKLAEIEKKASNVKTGLEKLEKGAEDVESMKIVLAKEEIKLQKANDDTTKMLGTLQKSSMAAKKEADAVNIIKKSCEEEAHKIALEKADAEKDLAKAMPFVEEAERAANSIKPNDLNEVKKLGKPSDIIKLVFDLVGLLKMENMVKVDVQEITMGIGKEKRTFGFIKDSFKNMQGGMLADSSFLKNIFYFSKYEKDMINDETIEFMQPYLDIEEYNTQVAKNASKAAEGLCAWTKAMCSYQAASKIVKPKLEALGLAQGKLDEAQKELNAAEAKLKGVIDILNGLQKKFEDQMAVKAAIELGAKKTRDKMQQATDLIGGLAGERKRWTEDSAKFDATKTALVGDVAVGCAFVSYCGPFNQEFRDYILNEKLVNDLKKQNVPCSPSLDVISLLVDVSETSDWALSGLPGDPLSIQNGIVVTRSSRYPLLIDPQGQAIKWIRQHEAERLPTFGSTAITHPRLKDQLEFAMAEGQALIIAGVEEELDPMLDPVLNKQWIQKGKSKYINLMDKLCEFQESFALYLITRLPNPHFSPEDQAKCVVVDFTVTRKGLEEQLLGRVIQKEQRSLEEQLSSVLNDVSTNTKALLRLDELLLERLSANTGNLLDDDELIAVLAETKTKAVEVGEKLIEAGITKASIDEKREQYRPAATRGSVLYFAIVDMSQVNVMYQTSLDQFQGLFDLSMDLAERASLASKRVANVIDTMTYIVYRYISRGLYEKDRLSFKLLVLFNILVTAGRLTPSEVTLFLKGGAALDLNAVKPKPVAWLSDMAWLNIIQLSSDSGAVVFRSLPDDIVREEAKWKAWYNDNEPERQAIPGNYQPRFETDPNGEFYRMLLVRSLREDRTILCVDDFITKMETIDVGGTKLPCMGLRFTQPVTETIEMTYADMAPSVPIVYLLSAGADPTDTVQTYAHKKKKHITCVSMGEGQEPVALRAINSATVEGMWVMLQNCHLGLPFMEGLEDLLGKIRVAETTLPDFRLFITCEPNPKFPIGLLQLAVKVTCQPPSGLRAGLMRSYTVIVDQDRLERVETAQWRVLVYALCFQHSVVQERRKYGAMGWCVPYEYNDGDISACLLFLERHLYQGALSWPTLQYMVAEVQYGGKITDNNDRRLFSTYANQWLTSATTKPGFAFRPSETLQKIENDFAYGTPPGDTHDDYAAFAKTLPSVDSPEVFGLHPNAELAFQTAGVRNLLATILETQPKGGGSSGGGPTREDVVYAKCEEILQGIPDDYVEAVYAKSLDMSQPLDVFLFQEIERLQFVIGSVRHKSNTILGAIRGEVVITQQIIEGINAIFDAKVPNDWVVSAAGDETSWQAPTIGFWAAGLGSRDEQLRKWIAGKGRPKSYWFPGWSNAAGFLTAVQQEVTRRHRNEGWALDGVRVDSEVTEYDRAEQVRNPPPEGVYISGLSLDGAIWDKSSASLAEAKPKVLFCEMPILFVTAVSKTAKKSGDLGPFGGFSCPVYKYVRRTDRYIIFSVNLPTQQKPDHWILRGVALLCFTS